MVEEDAFIGLLAELAELCGRAHELDTALGPALRLLSERVGLRRATLALLDDERGELRVEAAHGLTPGEIRRARMAPGQGVVGRVIATGEAAQLPRISDAAEFVDWTGVLQHGVDPGYLVAPLLHEGRCIGALCAYRLDARPGDLDRDLGTLCAAAGLLAPLARPHLRSLGVDAPQAPSDKRLQPDNLVGRSKAMRAVFDLMGQVAGTSTTVLLRGESGTGKELVAQGLHAHSPRAAGPFIKVNCAALPEGVIESELFGHERGAFTGALRERKGRFELARGGTLFLDEIGDLSPAMQVKLLRVLQEGEFERVGGTQTLRSDARIITATSRPLEEMIEDERFRPDLYYRLNVFPIRLPALRERKADILLLADHFVELVNKAHGRHVRRISTSAIDMLMAYHWPGNVRELENCIERAVLVARGDVLLGHHLPPTLQTAEATDTEVVEGLDAQLSAFERELILDALKSHRGNMAAAARDLGITERVMGLRVKRYGVDWRRFRESG
ncbi:MAG: sigma 54-interacting transcriptional regulator [Alphaproteobacteria bacterium]|nr:sigma 54-interacting transcriptional regulator [Alphaproteobacteria bacterium]MCB9797963.1 sigma 54-interacting transcriptional regulator [Alphaproteobacteria bacterium]